MKAGKLFLSAAAWLLLVQSCRGTLNWDIYTDAVIDEAGYMYNRVRIYDMPPDQTTVNMVGGRVDQMETFDTSILNIAGGTTYSLYAGHESFVTISRAKVFHILTWDNATVNFFEGGLATSLSARDSSTVNMAAGATRYLRAGESGTVNLYAGVVSDCLSAWDSGSVNIYGYGFNYDPTGGDWDGGQVTGFYLNGTPFAIDIYDADTFARTNLVPEPGSLILLSLGSLFVGSRKWGRTVQDRKHG